MEKVLSNQLQQLLSSCRLCLETPSDRKQLQPLFPGDLPHQIFRCTGIKAEEDQRLSSVVCSQCVMHLANSHSFLLKCNRSYDFLQSLLTDVKLELNPETEYDRLANDHDTTADQSNCKIKRENHDFKLHTIEIYHENDPNIDSRNLNLKSDRSRRKTIGRSVDGSEPVPSLVRIKNEPLSSEDDRVDREESFGETAKSNVGRKNGNFKKKMKPSSKTVKVKLKKLKKEKNHQLLQCDTCSVFVKSYSSMVTHIRTHTGEKPFKCNVCGRCFSQKATLRVHVEALHPSEEQQKKRSIPCETCGKILKSKKNLKIHLRIHTGETPYECPFCFKSFNQIGTLISHKRTHTGEKPYVCVTCGKAFAVLNHLKDHQRVHSEERPYACELCDAKFKCPNNLKQHFKLHTNEKESVCEECGLSYLTKGYLDSHKRRVHSEKSGQCNVCKMTFSDLKRHMMKHTGEKPFCCDVCDKRFACIQGFKSHSRQHSSKKDKFECPAEGCDLAFSAEWVLKNHILKHTGELPHCCKVCSKRYVRVSDLTRHMKMHHPDLPFTILKNHLGHDQPVIQN